MEDQLAVLERLIRHLNAGLIGRESHLKGLFLQEEWPQGRADELGNTSAGLPDQALQEAIRSCNVYLLESCKLADIVISLSVSLKMKENLTADEFYRLMKCDALLNEFKTLIQSYRVLLMQKTDFYDL